MNKQTERKIVSALEETREHLENGNPLEAFHSILSAAGWLKMIADGNYDFTQDSAKNIQIFIMCQGRGSRWSGSNLPCQYKQMLPIGDEPNLLRTIRMLEEYEQENYTVVAASEMFENNKKPKPGHLISLREPTGSILSGIIETKGERPWGEDSLFLLGDVVFSRKVIASCLADRGTGIFLFGRTGRNPLTNKQAGELFAIRVVGVHAVLVGEIQKLIKSRGDRPVILRLWDLQRAVGATVIEVDGDWSDDFDSPAQLIYYREIEEAALHDLPPIAENA